jgi:hypothetical protein
VVLLLEPPELAGPLTVGDEDNEEALEAVVFCLTCATREFDGF